LDGEVEQKSVIILFIYRKNQEYVPPVPGYFCLDCFFPLPKYDNIYFKFDREG